MVMNQISTRLRRLSSMVRGMVRRGTMSGLDSGGSVQKMQVRILNGQSRDEVEHMEPYGFTSAPPANSDAVILKVGGDSSHCIAICVGSRQVRITGLAQGEIAIGTPNGARIILRNNGDIEAIAGDEGVILLGGPDAELAVARDTDDVSPTPAMIDWMTAMSVAVSTMSAAFNVAGPLVGAPLTVPVNVIADLPPPATFANIDGGSEGVNSV